MNALKESYMRGMKDKNGSTDKGKMLEHFTVRKADNGGFVVDCSYRNKKKGKDGMEPSGYEMKTNVFSNAEAAMEFAEEMMDEM